MKVYCAYLKKVCDITCIDCEKYKTISCSRVSLGFDCDGHTITSINIDFT